MKSIHQKSKKLIPIEEIEIIPSPSLEESEGKIKNIKTGILGHIEE